LVAVAWDIALFSVYGIFNCAVAGVALEGVNWTVSDSESPGLREAVDAVTVKLLGPNI
jgi:hypothetical protein